MALVNIKNGTFILGDCLEEMKQIPDGCIDMILCDLPYGTTACKWDTIIPFDELWVQYRRVCKGPVILTAGQPFTSFLITSNVSEFKYCWTWDKVKPNGHLVAKHRPMQRTEDICVFNVGDMVYNPIMTPRETVKKSKEYKRTEIMGGSQTGSEKQLTEKYPQTVLVYSNASQKDKFHPTQKPVELFEYLIKTYTNDGGLVLDNCAGSGTTAIACENLNRKWVCIEKDETYFNQSLERINNHVPPVKV